eukprot:7602882-Lingulodinium_polyedra.AAC.2
MAVLVNTAQDTCLTEDNHTSVLLVLPLVLLSSKYTDVDDAHGNCAIGDGDGDSDGTQSKHGDTNAGDGVVSHHGGHGDELFFPQKSPPQAMGVSSLCIGNCQTPC